jgi:SAM-dependent methyltransferase
MWLDGSVLHGQLPCVACRHARRRKTPSEWRELCGACRGLSEQELELLAWYQEHDNDRVVIPPNIFRYSRDNSRQRYQAVRDALAAAGARRGARILDIGCGISANADLFRDFAYVGADVNIPRLQWAGRRQPWARYAVQDITRMGWADRAFDYVVCLEVIEHLPPPARHQLLRELLRVVQPEGRLFLSTPNGTVTFWKRVFGIKCERSHEDELSPAEVEQLVASVGGQVERHAVVDNLVLPAGRPAAVLTHLIADRPALRRRVTRLAGRAAYQVILYIVRPA